MTVHGSSTSSTPHRPRDDTAQGFGAASRSAATAETWLPGTKGLLVIDAKLPTCTERFAAMGETP